MERKRTYGILYCYKTLTVTVRVHDVFQRQLSRTTLDESLEAMSSLLGLECCCANFRNSVADSLSLRFTSVVHLRRFPSGRGGELDGLALASSEGMFLALLSSFNDVEIISPKISGHVC